MSKENLIVINADLGETRVALIENGMIVELLLERRLHRSQVGNIYKGRITRVLPGMQAAFIDIGLDKHAFLHASDLSATEGEAPSRAKGSRKSQPHPISKLIKEGQFIAVQVSKDQIGTKGCRVTSEVSLAGRHLVYMPMSSKSGISRKIENDKERARLGKILPRIAPSEGALIARTVAFGASADALEADATYLSETWQEINEIYKSKKKPSLLYEELELPLRVARDYLNDSVSQIVVDNREVEEKLTAFIDRLVPSRLDSVKRYDGEEPIFDAFGIESEIRRALDRVVELPSGGSLVIDQGEALTAVDVNTGKFVGKGSRDQEETILRTNLEAVDEIAYQMRFRNIGGLIVLDLIDMVSFANRRKVANRLTEKLKEDRAKTSVNEISRFGLMEMTRERTRESLGRTLHERCSYCDGTGNTLSRVTVANEVLREIQRRHDEIVGGEIEVRLHPHVAEVFKGEGAAPLKALQDRISKKVNLKEDRSLHMEHFQVQLTRSPK